VLKSAYSSYSWDGEPPLTCVEQNFVGTLDYIMYSSEKLVRTLENAEEEDRGE
jgi:mRNA deadenylase 3'-5' endonuclease subunit Ccr4